MPFIESTSKFSSGLSLLYILKIEGKTLFYKELFDNNIIFIKDILDEENKFKTYDELKNQLNCKLNFLKLLNQLLNFPVG
jgi:hypothetical protein